MDYNLHNTIIEADSKLMINLVKRISTSKTQDKISNHWQLSQVFHRVQYHLRTLRTLSFIHVLRDANRVADRLANEGVICIEKTSATCGSSLRMDNYARIETIWCAKKGIIINTPRGNIKHKSKLTEVLFLINR